MRKIIQNEFTYYHKNYSKLALSLLLVVSFFVLLFSYDTLELETIKKEAIAIREESSDLRFDLTRRVDNDYRNKRYDQLDNPEITYDDETQHIVDLLNEDALILNDLDTLYSGYLTLHYGGRMNLELTPYRHGIYTNLIRHYEIIEELSDSDLPIIDRFNNFDHLKAEAERLNMLMETETPDDFNYYTVTFANYPSKVFEGVMLFVILIIILLLFYDLISKDFVNLTYKNIYTTPIKRNEVIAGKLLFALIYTVLLIGVGVLIVSLYLLFIRRIGYNVLDNRRGYMFHPQIINKNILSFLNNEISYSIIPQIFKNIISVILGISIMLFWILLIVYLSFKLKSSNSNLTILSFVLIAAYLANYFNFKKYFQYSFPIFNFNYDKSITGENPINFVYIFLITSVYNFVLYSLIHRDISKIDLLDGEYDA